jgi:hypothetical protein
MANRCEQVITPLSISEKSKANRIQCTIQLFFGNRLMKLDKMIVLMSSLAKFVQCSCV